MPFELVLKIVALEGFIDLSRLLALTIVVLVDAGIIGGSIDGTAGTAGTEGTAGLVGLLVFFVLTAPFLLIFLIFG